MARWYVTVSIPYVNAAPHVGYALELVEADALARARRQAGDEVRLLGGTDDHSLSNVLAAEEAGLSTEEFVATSARRFADLAAPLEISFDDFIHTSSDRRHAAGVERLWRESARRGDFYRRSYSGSYCVRCEQFYAEKELDEGRCKEHGTIAEDVEEENWFFRLSVYEEQLRTAIERRAIDISPEVYRREVLSFLKGGLEDISVSRSSARAHGWGIAVPGDPGQVVYVWWDALANYVTALGYATGDAALEKWWSRSDERVHIVGKGILKFHAVYWPALLLSAGLSLPTRIYVHPYLTAEGQKISKSAGNGPDPLAVVAQTSTDALRWWLCRSVAPTTDADFSLDRLVTVANDDLANGLGNLAGRIATMAERFCGATTPETPLVLDARQQSLSRQLSGLEEEVIVKISSFKLREATLAITGAVTELNRYIELTRPWELFAHEDATGSASSAGPSTVGFLVSSLCQLATAVRPFLPAGAARIEQRIGEPASVTSPDRVAFRRLERPS